MSPQIKQAKLETLEAIIKEVEGRNKKLEKGCDGFEEYWGHKCGIWITNTQGENVHVFCNRCVAKKEALSDLLTTLQAELEIIKKEI